MLYGHTAPVGLNTRPRDNALVFVAHDKNVAGACRRAGQQRHQFILGGVGVLEFVHQNVLPLALILLPHLQILPQEQGSAHEQIVKVHGVVQEEHLLIASVDTPAHLFKVAGGLHPLRAHQFILPIANLGAHGLGAEALLVQIHFLQNRAHQRELICAVVDDPIGLKACRLHIHPQDAGANVVECPNRQPAQPLALARRWRRKIVPNQMDNPLFHLPGRFVGKGDGQDIPGRDAPLFDQIGDAPGEYPRLAGAWPGQHQHRSFGRLHRLALGSIEVVQNL